ncbi:ABC transporter substrate-binding protein [Paenibacillus hodogayensis]|uniref:ABC transporter substrate-binding protein n=1 Tax=Paenibacillus hodogayensis TaxID=279208 RepID=A0ABV5W7V6_9BACL
MKKITTSIVCFTAVSLLISGCSSSSSGQKESANTTKPSPVTLSVMSWENENAMKPLLEGFKAKYPDIKIDFQFTPPTKDYIQKLKTTLLTGSATDVFVMAYENKDDIIRSGYALDLTNEPFMSIVSDFNKQTYSANGKVYGFAQSAWAGGIFYNKKLFAKAGVQVPTNWQEFIDASKKLKAAGITPYLDNLQDMAANIVSGLFITETHAKNPKFDEEVNAGKKKYVDGWTIPAQLWYNDMYKNGLMTQDMLGLSWDQQQNEFATEKVAMSPGGPWCIKVFNSANPNLDFGMMPYPGVDANNAHWAGAAGIAYAINAKTKVKEAAAAFLSYMATPEGLELYNKGTGQIISAKGGEKFAVHPSLEDAKKGLLKNDIWNPSGGWQNPEAIRNVLQTSLQETLAGKIKPEQIAQNMDKKFEEMNKK